MKKQMIFTPKKKKTVIVTKKKPVEKPKRGILV